MIEQLKIVAAPGSQSDGLKLELAPAGRIFPTSPVLNPEVSSVKALLFEPVVSAVVAV